MRLKTFFLPLILVMNIAQAQVLSDTDRIKLFTMSQFFPEIVKVCSLAVPAKAPSLNRALSAYLAAHHTAILEGEALLNNAAVQRKISLSDFLEPLLKRTFGAMPSPEQLRGTPFCETVDTELLVEASRTEAQIAQLAFEQELRDAQFGSERCDVLESKVFNSSRRYLDLFSLEIENGGSPDLGKDINLTLNIRHLQKASRICADMQKQAKLRGIKVSGEFQEMQNVTFLLSEALSPATWGPESGKVAKDAARRFVNSTPTR